MMKKLFLGTVGIFSLALLITVFATPADAYRFYSDPAGGEDGGQNCAACHGDFGRNGPDYVSVAEGFTWPGGDLHAVHTANLTIACSDCHFGLNTVGRGTNLGSSSTAPPGESPISCSGCHVQAGLVLHHDINGITECAGCHPGLTSAPENIAPPWYDSVTNNASGTLLTSCNAAGEEDFSGDPAMLGLDNDGDNLYDTADPDCTCGNGVVDPGEDCDPSAGSVCCEADCTYSVVDTACGDPSDTECNNPDTCDGMGACLDNYELLDSPCGTQGVECQIDDTCDGMGACTDNGNQPDGFGCGDPTATQCDNGDICLTGVCDPNYEPATTACEDGLFCTTPDSCDGAGLCAPGAGTPCQAGEVCTEPDTCTAAQGCGNGVVEGTEECDDGNLLDGDCCSSLCTIEPAGSPCGDATVDECNLADTCNGVGPIPVCLDNYVAAGSACGDTGIECLVDDTCNGMGMCNDNGLEPDGTSCGDPTVTQCDNADSCLTGACDPNYVAAATPCDDGLFCTDPDACDGIGLCDGGPSPCLPGEVCAEDPPGPPGYLCEVDTAAPPVNQILGFVDTTIANSGLERADCLAVGCHMEAGIEDRHHLLYNSMIPSPTVVPYPMLTTNYPGPPTYYNCLGCHDEVFTLELECGNCHLVDGAVSPHHTTAAALARDCVSCHGDLVDNFDDGHYIPTYGASLVTPTPSEGDGGPLNNRNNGAGACNYCHDDDGLPSPVILSNEETHHGTSLFDNGDCSWCHEPIPTMPDDPNWPQPLSIRRCEECHGPDSLHNIQADSNGDNIIEVGGELAGFGHIGRDQGPGDSDCWGCHGFAGVTGAAPGSGPVVPSVGGADVSTMTAGTATVVTLSGAAFTNIDGATQYVSDVSLTGADGSSVTLTPSSVSEGSMTVTIPADTAAGNYNLQAVKAQFASNPAVISVIPEVSITGTTCTDGTATISGGGFAAEGGSVTGTVATQGTDCSPYSSKKTCNRQDGCQWDNGASECVSNSSGGGGTETAQINSWADTQITASFSACPADVTVNSIYGSATSDGGGTTTTTTTTLPPSGSCSDLGESQCIADSSCDWKCNKKNRCSCVDGGGTTTTTLPPSGSCSDNGDQGSCEAAGCNWNSKKSVCR